MGFLRGFIEFERIEQPHVPVEERVKSFCEIYGTLTDEQAKIQAGRCMDCGIPFCMHECPLHNDSPDFNEFVSEEQMSKAYNVLSATNNFPEITGRICPALCEEGCTLGIHRKAVGIKSVERKIAEYAFEHGLVKPVITEHRSGKKVCVVGSGPAALAAAQQLNRFGHTVTVVEKMNKIGGLLRYGIPDFKLPKEILDRRISQLEQEGITFKTSTIVGAIKNLEHGVHNDSLNEVRGQELLDNYDAIVLAPGSEAPRDLRLPGRDLKGIYFALDFLIAQNRENNGDCENPIDVRGKNVVVIGGGETASDCIGVSIRKGAASVTQLDYHDELPESVDLTMAWPDWRKIKRTSTSHEEGCTRLFSTNTTAFEGKDKLEAVVTEKVKWGEGRHFEGIKGTESKIKADVVLIAMGYSHPSSALIKEFALETDKRGNIKAEVQGESAYQTSNKKVFAAGDGRKGQSLVVYAIAEGRQCAAAVDDFLKGNQSLNICLLVVTSYTNRRLFLSLIFNLLMHCLREI